MLAQVAQKDVQQSGFIAFSNPQVKLADVSQQSSKGVQST